MSTSGTSTQRRSPAVLLLFVIMLTTLSAGAQDTVSSVEPPPDLQEETHAELEALRNEMTELRAEAADALERARKIERAAHEEMALMASTAQTVIGFSAALFTVLGMVVTIVVAGVVTFFLRRLRQMKRTQADLTAIRVRLEETWAALDADFDNLPEEERDVVVGSDDVESEPLECRARPCLPTTTIFSFRATG